MASMGDEWLEFGSEIAGDGDLFAEYFQKQQQQEEICESKNFASEAQYNVVEQCEAIGRSKKHATSSEDPYVYFDEAGAGSSQRRKRSRNSTSNSAKLDLEADDDDCPFPSQIMCGEKSVAEIADMNLSKMNMDPTSREGKRLRRLLRNRLSAQLHRERKRVYIEKLELDIRQRDQRIIALTQALNEKEKENKLLRTTIDNMTSRGSYELLSSSTLSRTMVPSEDYLSDGDIDRLMSGTSEEEEEEDQSRAAGTTTTATSSSSGDDTSSDKSFRLYSFFLSPLLIWLGLVLMSFTSSQQQQQVSDVIDHHQLGQLIPYQDHHHWLRGPVLSSYQDHHHHHRTNADDDHSKALIVCLDSIYSPSKSSIDSTTVMMMTSQQQKHDDDASLVNYHHNQDSNSNRVFLMDSSSSSSVPNQQTRIGASLDNNSNNYSDLATGQPEVILKFIVKSSTMGGLLDEYNHQKEEKADSIWLELECLLLNVRNVAYSLQE